MLLMPMVLDVLHNQFQRHAAAVNRLPRTSGAHPSPEHTSADGVVASLLRALTFIAGRSSTVGQITVLFVAVLSQHGSCSIQRIMDLSPGVYSQFFDTLHVLRTNQQIEQARHRELLENISASADVQPVQQSQLPIWFSRNIYMLAFCILDSFGDIPVVLVQTLKALSQLICISHS
jgi:hypothetical protein